MATITFTVQAKEIRDDNRQVVFFTIERNGYEFRYSHGSVPIEADTDEKIILWLKQRQDAIFVLTLNKVFPGADYMRFKTDENSELEAFMLWVQDGHKQEDGTVIPDSGWRGNHPKWIEWETEIDAITNLAGVKEVLKKIVRKIK